MVGRRLFTEKDGRSSCLGDRKVFLRVTPEDLEPRQGTKLCAVRTASCEKWTENFRISSEGRSKDIFTRSEIFAYQEASTRSVPRSMEIVFPCLTPRRLRQPMLSANPFDKELCGSFGYSDRLKRDLADGLWLRTPGGAPLATCRCHEVPTEIPEVC